MFAKQLEFYLFEEILQIYSNKCQEFLREFNKILTDMCNILYPSFPNAKCHWNMLIVAHFLHVSLIETLRNVNLKFLCNTLAGSKTFYEIFMADLKEMNWVVDMIGRYEKLGLVSYQKKVFRNWKVDYREGGKVQMKGRKNKSIFAEICWLMFQYFVCVLC